MGETMKLLAEEDLQAGNCMRQVFDTIRRHHIAIEPNVMMAAVTMIVLEGWQHRLDPDMLLLEELKKRLKAMLAW